MFGGIWRYNVEIKYAKFPFFERENVSLTTQGARGLFFFFVVPG